MLKKKLTLTGSTMLEQFENYIEGHNTIGGIRDFLEEKGMHALAVIGMNENQISPELADDICEFADYFYEFFDDEDFLDEHGQPPLILHLAGTIYEQMEEKMLQSLQEMSAGWQKKEAEQLMETILSIKKQRTVHVSCANGYEESFELPRTIMKKERKEICRFLALTCHMMVVYGGFFVVHTTSVMEDDEMFGYMCVAGHKWEALTVGDMQEMFGKDPREIRGEWTGKNIRYISAPGRQVKKKEKKGNGKEKV